MEQALARWVARLFYRYPAHTLVHLNSLAGLFLAAAIVVPTGEPPPCSDESDRKYLHCAVTARVDYLVSQDCDLLDIEQIAAVPIVRPATFLALAERAGWVLDP